MLMEIIGIIHEKKLFLLEKPIAIETEIEITEKPQWFNQW